MACVDNQVVDIGISAMKQESEFGNSSCDNPTSTQSSNQTESNHKILKYNTIPKLLVDECSPNKWEPQIAEYISNSIQTSPGASSDRSPNSYVTAKEKLTPLPSADFSFGNSEENTSTNQNHESSSCTNSSVGGEPFVNALSSSSSTEDNSTVTLNSESSPVSILNNIDNSPGNSPPEENSSTAPSVKVTYPHRVTFPSDDLSLTQSINSSQRDSTEPFGESDEDYFEEYHLPNTHENAFVRHVSFRRKVQTTPINAPDAERIEGLLRTGEFIRHGSIRRKIVPEEEVVEEEYEDDDDDIYNENEDKNSSSFTDRIERDIHEIERYLSGEDVNEYSSIGKSTPGNIKHMKRTASTPKAGRELNVDNYKSDLSINAGIEPSNIFEENVSIEESTLRKIQECLDFSAYKDILNLSGRISDLLSPKEVEEVLNNSERYRQYLNTEVIEALSLSYQEQSHSLPCTINFQSNSGSANSTKSGSKSNKLSNDNSGISFTNTPESEINGFLRSNSQNELHLVERNVGACDGIGARGIFVESLGPMTDLKKIPAPEVNLDWSSESKYEDGDLETSDRQYLENSPPKKKISVTKDILDFTEYPQDIDLASEAIEKDLERYKQRNISQTILESETEIPPLNLSSIPPLNLSSIPPPPDLIPELTAAEEMSEVRHWRNVVIGGAWRRIDMKAIAPFRKCISHGGYMDDNSQSPIVVISAALLPDRTRKDYDYVMDNLFMYVLSFLEQLVADDYVLIYFSGGKQNGSGGPGFHWMRRAYEMIDRRLRKNLKSLLIVHPSLWARTILTLSRPFISSKFYRKLKFVHHLTDLAMMVPLEQLEIPDAVKQADFQIMIKEKKKIMNR